ncbi:MAG: AgmX/PglI C-terminal domain-containing protein [Nannocystales bacterium]
MSAPSKSGSKVLRLVVVVDETVSEDLHQTAPGGVSVGTHHNADVVLFGKKAPTRHQLFDVRQGAYFLDLPPDTRGKVRVGKKAVSVAKLRQRYGKGNTCRIKLDPRAKGKLRIGQSTLVFQFGPPKPVPPRLPFPAIFKASVVGMVGALFVYSQLIATGLLGPVFLWANFSEVPVHDEMDIDERFLVAVGHKPKDEREEEPEEEEIDEDQLAEEDEDVVETKDKPKPENNKKLDKKPKKFSKAAVKQARSVGVARVLGTYGGDGPGTVFDVIQSTENRLGEFADAGFTTTVEANGPLGDLAPIGGDGIDLHGQLTQTKGFDTGDGPAVDKGVKKRERKIKGRAKASGTSAAGGGDKKAIKATIKHRTSALQHCYNKALRVQPDLSGKMSFAIVINVMGSVTSVAIEEDTLGHAGVKACTKAKIKGWRFPMNGAEEGADVSFSVVFSGS